MIKVLKVYNLHRGGGGADNATLATISALEERGVKVTRFKYDSNDVPNNLFGKVSAFYKGIYNHQAVQAFKKKLAQEKPDLVHVYELYPLISPWILPLCSKHNVPVIMTCYDYRLTCPITIHQLAGQQCTRCVGGNEHQAILQNCRNNYLESTAYAARSASARLFKLIENHVDHFITPTQFAADWLVTHSGIQAHQMTVVPCEIDIPKTAADPSQGEYIGYAGRFVPEKGIEVLIEAAKKANLPVKFAGDSLAYPGTENNPLFSFVLTKNKAELAEFYRGAKMLVMPSTWFETFGIVAGESMSHGIPVIASKIGALTETVRDGETGLHFKTGDVDDLAEKITHLWHDSDLLKTLGGNARKHIISHSNKSSVTEKIIALYEQITHKPAGSPQRNVQ